MFLFPENTKMGGNLLLKVKGALGGLVEGLEHLVCSCFGCWFHGYVQFMKVHPSKFQFKKLLK